MTAFIPPQALMFILSYQIFFWSVFWNECGDMLARSIRDSKALASMAKVKSAGRVLMLPYTSTSMDSVTGRDIDVYVPLK
jgi:hypothetical protein